MPILSHLFRLWPGGRTDIRSHKRLLVGVETHFPLSPLWAKRFRSRPLTANPSSAKASALRCFGS